MAKADDLHLFLPSKTFDEIVHSYVRRCAAQNLGITFQRFLQNVFDDGCCFT
jgi:hypothetical protein